MKKVFIRSKGDQNSGWGNVIRQLKISQYLIQKKYKVYFFIETDSNLSRFLISSKIKIIKLKKNISIKNEKKILKKYGKSNFSIIEMLKPPIYLQKFYLEISTKLIIYDDLLDGKYLSNILISCQDSNLEKKRVLNKNLKFYSGYKYFPINYKLEKNLFLKKKINKIPKKLNIILGGSSYELIYFKIAKALKKFSNIKIKIF